MHMVRKNNRGSLNHPIDFMDLFEDVLVNEDLNKLRAKHQHYLLNIDVRTMVWLKHQQLLEIEHSPPAPKKNFYSRGITHGNFTKMSTYHYMNHNKSMDCLHTNLSPT